MVLFEFGRRRPDRLTALYSAYLAEGGPGRIATEADFTMVIAQLHHICQLHLRRWLQPASDDAARPRAIPYIYEYLDEPPDRKVLSEILSVTRAIDSSNNDTAY